MKREIIEYNPKLKERARELRNNATPMEKKLWVYIKGKQINDFDFHRQKPINNFIVDFYCSELKLAIEIDGSSHDNKKQYDIERQNIIEKYGITFLRFTNTDISKNIEGVLEIIRNWVIEHRHTSSCSQEVGSLYTSNPSQEGNRKEGDLSETLIKFNKYRNDKINKKCIK